jgi:hypothetical protein
MTIVGRYPFIRLQSVDHQPAPLFKKLEESIIQEERARLGQSNQ